MDVLADEFVSLGVTQSVRRRDKGYKLQGLTLPRFQYLRVLRRYAHELTLFTTSVHIYDGWKHGSSTCYHIDSPPPVARRLHPRDQSQSTQVGRPKERMLTHSPVMSFA